MGEEGVKLYNSFEKMASKSTILRRKLGLCGAEGATKFFGTYLKLFNKFLNENTIHVV